MSTPLRLAVVTGGHPFDVPGFHHLLQGIGGSDLETYVQHLEDIAAADRATLASYDVVLFYCMPADAPRDLPGTQAIRPREALEVLIAQGTGLLILHHALLAYPSWERWDDLVGVQGRHRFTYHGDQEVTCRPVGACTVTEGLSPWTMRDETYGLDEPQGEPVLTTTHPRSMSTLAWARMHDGARVLCVQPGHDAQAWQHPSYIRLLRQGIRWTARRTSLR